MSKNERYYSRKIVGGGILICAALTVLLVIVATSVTLTTYRELSVGVFATVLGLALSEVYNEAVPRARDRKERTQKSLQDEVKHAELLSRNESLRKELEESKYKLVQIRGEQEKEETKKIGAIAQIGFFMVTFWLNTLTMPTGSPDDVRRKHAEQVTNRQKCLSIAGELGLQYEVGNLLSTVERTHAVGIDRAVVQDQANIMLARISTKFGDEAFEVIALQLSLLESLLKGPGYLSIETTRKILEKCDVNKKTVEYCLRCIDDCKMARCSPEAVDLFAWALATYMSDHLNGRRNYLVQLFEGAQPPISDPAFNSQFTEALGSESIWQSRPDVDFVNETNYRFYAMNLGILLARRLLYLWGVKVSEEQSTKDERDSITIARILSVESELSFFLQLRPDNREITQSGNAFMDAAGKVATKLSESFGREVAYSFHLSWNFGWAILMTDYGLSEAVKPQLKKDWAEHIENASKALSLKPEVVKYLDKMLVSITDGKLSGVAAWNFMEVLRIYVSGAHVSQEDAEEMRAIFEDLRPDPNYYLTMHFSMYPSFVEMETKQ